jgi:hypothetical protein
MVSINAQMDIILFMSHVIHILLLNTNFIFYSWLIIWNVILQVCKSWIQFHKSWEIIDAGCMTRVCQISVALSIHKDLFWWGCINVEITIYISIIWYLNKEKLSLINQPAFIQSEMWVKNHQNQHSYRIVGWHFCLPFLVTLCYFLLCLWEGLKCNLLKHSGYCLYHQL